MMARHPGLDILTEGERKRLLALARWYYKRCERHAAWDMDDLISAGVVGVLEARRRECRDEEHYNATCWLLVKSRMSELFHTAAAAKSHKDTPADERFQTFQELQGEPAERPQIDWEANGPREARLEELMGCLTDSQREAVSKYYGVLGHPRELRRCVPGERNTALWILRRVANGGTQRRKVRGCVVDRTGVRSGHLVAVEPADRPASHSRAYWRCRCDCGGEAVVLGEKVGRGEAKTCGRQCPHNGANKSRAERSASKSA